MVIRETDPGDADMEDVTPSEPLYQPVEDPGEPMDVTSIREIGTGEEPSTADNPLYGEYLWTVENLSSFNSGSKLYSEIFEAGGYYWNLLVFPKGNNGRSSLSVYLNVPDTDGPYGWHRRAKFVLILLNRDPAKNIVKDTEHLFEGKENDWGFTQFTQLSDLDEAHGFVQDDCLKLQVKITVEHPDSYLYNSKRETGFVGLKNQGATCYMNSLLQTLYNINFFRQAVYHMPTSEDEIPSKSIPLALQSLFFKLQFGDHSVSTKNLTQSFGWTTMDAFTQHDVQELNRILSDRLEEKMKGTKVEGTIGKLFEGRIHNFVECINVDYTSTREEVYADLQLLVKGCRNMYDSFDKYVEVEKLDGQNQYMAEGHGLQDAKKGMLFDSFPPVLQIQLRRFEYDFVRDTMIKINDRYEFPEELDLDIEDGKYLSPKADRSIRNKYRLHSVLVHSGGIHGGHYYAFINPSGQQWLKFDDERVTKEDARQALDEQMGGQDEPAGYNVTYKYTKFSNAYMLVYIRESDWNTIMCEVTKADLAAHVRERLEKELADKERARKEKEESHLYTIIKVARDSDMRAQIGQDIFFDLANHDKVESFRVKKFSKFRDFRKLIAKEWGISPENQFWWGWERRTNGTYRPVCPFGEAEDAMQVCAIKEKSSQMTKPWPPRLHLFLQETPNDETAKLLASQFGRREYLLLLLKRYNPREQKLEYAGNVVAPRAATLKSMLVLLCARANLPKDTELLVWEEVKYQDGLMINIMHQDRPLFSEQINNGDLLIVQEKLSEEEARTLKYPEAPMFLNYVRNRKLVSFKQLEDPKEAGFELELSVQMGYSDVESAVARKLGLGNPQMLRFTPHNNYTQAPKPSPFSYRGVDTLPDMLLMYGSQAASILYYEVLDLPLPELEKLKIVKVSWHNQRGEQIREHKLRVPKDAAVSDLIAALQNAEPDAAKAKGIRLMETLNSKIYKVYETDSAEPVNSINDTYWTMRAEAVPEDELDIPEGDRIIFLCHVSVNEGKHVTMFGDSICMRVSTEERMDDLAKRIQARLGVADEDFAKWRFCVVKGISSSSAEWLEPDDIVAEKFIRQSGIYGGGGDQPYLGLHHSVTHSKRAQARNTSVYERAIKINS